MMKISILDVDTLGDDLDLSHINELGDVTVYPVTFAEDVPKRIKDPEILILNKVKLNSSNLIYAKNLKLICITATGYDNVDIDYCKEHGIAVCNIVGYSTNSVVQLTMAMAFTLLTNLSSFDEYVKSGKYEQSGIFNCIKPVFSEISGKTWGIVGYGNIGKKVAHIAEATGCKIIAYKRTPVDEVECCDIDTLCERADIISVHTPLNNETRNLINRERINKMKKSAILINVARGAVVNEEDITCAIEEGRIAGFGVDVYSTEPIQSDSPYKRILDYKNTVFTPHMAWGAYEARQRCIDEIVLNIKSFVSGEKRNRLC